VNYERPQSSTARRKLKGTHSYASLKQIGKPLEGESCSQRTDNCIIVVAVLTRRGQPDDARGD
jgi:hypothetical protein